MSAPSETRFVVLAAIDETDAAPRVLAAAARIAANQPDGELHVLRAFDRTRYADNTPMGTMLESQLTETHRRVDEQASGARALHTGRMITHVLDDDPVRSILHLASAIDADLIVVGAGTHPIARRVLGSVAERVMRSAPCPVLVARDKAHGDPSVPEIEPPCDDCVRMQRETGGATLWCDRHAKHHPRAHLHYAYPPSFGEGSQLIRPS